MTNRHLIALLFLISASILPAAVFAQQPDAKRSENQTQAPSVPVQPEHTPQQADQTREQDKRSAEETRVNPNWTTRQRDDLRPDMQRQRRMDRSDQDWDSRTVGRNRRRDDDQMERGWMDRDDGRRYENRPYRRVKTCIEYENGDEFCRYMD